MYDYRFAVYTFCNLIYCSFIGFCDLFLSLVLQSFPYWGGYGGNPPTTSQKVASPTTENQFTPHRAHIHTHTHTHTLTPNNNFQVITQQKQHFYL